MLKGWMLQHCSKSYRIDSALELCFAGNNYFLLVQKFITLKYLKIISDMHFKTPIQAYIEQNVIYSTVQTRNEEKKSSKKY